MTELEIRLCRFKITVFWTSAFNVNSKAKTKISKRYETKPFLLHLFLVQGGLVASVSQGSSSFPPSKVVRREGHAILYSTALP